VLPAPCQVLLILDVLIGRSHHVKPRRFIGLEKLAVFKLRLPLHFNQCATSCPDKKRRTPTGTFLSNRMRNCSTLQG